MLIMAAKAAGIEYKIGSHGAILELYQDGHAEWNPLTDDGDALRLAVKLDIDIEFHDDIIFVVSNIGINEQDINNDKYAATRRAIVRAAAEIGKEMP